MKIRVNLPKIELPIPSKLIWHVQLTDKEDDYPVQDFYFLSRRRAEKFMEESYKEVEDLNCRIGMGGEPLWFW